jgi:hypothetical protein
MSYDLKTILSTVSTFKKNSDKTKQVKKRILYDQAPIGGLSIKWFWLAFIAMPFIEYAAIFNPVVFSMLGIAQAIVFFIVFLSIVMILIFALYSFNNRIVIDGIKPMWEAYFPEVDVHLILTSSHSPYRDFFKEYSLIADEDLSDEALHEKLKLSMKKMEEENKDLLEAMQRSSRT